MKLLLASAFLLIAMGCKLSPQLSTARLAGPFTKVTFGNETEYDVFLSSGQTYRNSGLFGSMARGPVLVSSKELFRRPEPREGEPEFYVIFIWDLPPSRTNELHESQLPLATGYVPNLVAERSEIHAVVREDGLHIKAGNTSRIWPWHRKPSVPKRPALDQRLSTS